MATLNSALPDSPTGAAPTDDSSIDPSRATAKFKISNGGASYLVTVDNDFTKLPQEVQQQQLAAKFDEMNGVASPKAPADTSMTSAIGQGVHAAASGIGATLADVGLPQTGAAVAGAAGAPARYAPTDIAGSLRAGDYSGALKQLPRAVAEATPDLAGTLGAARIGAGVGSMAGSVFPGLGTAAGGLIGGAVGAGGYIAARNFGNNVDAVAANNNHASPTTGDYVQGAGTTGLQVGAGLVGAGKLPGVASRLAGMSVPARALAEVGLEVPGAAGQDIATQLGNSVGTEKGTQYDPYQTAASAAQAVAARGVSEVPGLAKAGAMGTAEAYANARTPVPSDPVQQASISRVASMMEDAKANAGGDTSSNALANNVKSELASQGMGYARELRDVGVITPTQYREAQILLQRQALPSNNTIATAGDGNAPTLYDRVSAWNLDPDVVKPITQAALDLNTVSSQSFQNRNNGPFRQLAGLAGTVAAGVGGTVAGGPVAGVMAALGGHKAAPVFGAVGGALDRLVGTDQPNVVRQAVLANRLLQQQGLTPGDNTLTMLDNARLGVADLQTRQRAIQAAIDPDPLSTMRTQEAFQSGIANDAAIKQAQIGQGLALGRVQAAKDAATASNVQADQDAAHAAVNLPAQSDIAAYMAGKGTSDAVPVAPIGQQTASEMAGWSQILRNREAVAKINAAQAGVLAKAEGSTTDNLAQSKLDAMARGNSVSIAAASKLPSVNPNVSEDAATAAVAQAMRKARAITALAGANPDVDTAVQVGNPTSVLTSLNPSPRPASVRRQSDLINPQAPHGSGMPSGGDLPDGPSGYPQAPWERFVADGHPLATREAIHRALDEMVGAGLMDPRTAGFLRQHQGGTDASVLEPIQQYLNATLNLPLGERRGASSGNGTAPEGYRGPIYDTQKYTQSVEQYRAHAGDKLALAAGDPDLQATITNIRDEPSQAGKEHLRSDYMTSLAKAVASGSRGAGVRLANASTLLSGPLMRSKVP